MVSLHSHWNVLPSRPLWFLLYVQSLVAHWFSPPLGHSPPHRRCSTLLVAATGPPGLPAAIALPPWHHIGAEAPWKPPLFLELQTKRGRNESSKTLSLNLHLSSLPIQKLPPYQQSKEKIYGSSDDEWLHLTLHIVESGMSSLRSLTISQISSAQARRHCPYLFTVPSLQMSKRDLSKTNSHCEGVLPISKVCKCKSVGSCLGWEVTWDCLLMVK